MTTLTARIHPATRSSRSVLAEVGAALRGLAPDSGAATLTLTELPGMGTLRVTELPGELVLVFTGDAGAEPSTVRRAVSQQIRQAAGSRSAAAELVITWPESHPRPVPETV